MKSLALVMSSDQIRSDQSLSCVRLFVTPWIAALQASLSIANSWSSLRLTSIESVMPSSHLVLCRTLLLLLPIPPSIRVFSNESTLRMRWPKYWSFSFSIIPCDIKLHLYWKTLQNIHFFFSFFLGKYMVNADSLINTVFFFCYLGGDENAKEW